MIYVERLHYMAGSTRAATADRLIELDAYASLLGVAVCLQGSLAFANVPRPAGEYKLLGQRDWIMAAAKLADRMYLEQAEVLALGNGDALYERYTRWAVAAGVTLPTEHLPANLSKKTDTQVKQSLLYHVQDGCEYGERVNLAYLTARHETLPAGSISRLMGQLVAEGSVSVKAGVYNLRG